MKYLNLDGNLNASAVIMGCMRLKQLTLKEAEALIQTALELGINYFDHADIYGGGSCESIFSEAIGRRPSIREKIILQGKCGIYKGGYDFSKEHILDAVDGILDRLKTEYLDVLLLHRPDTLMEPEEVAEAFSHLSKSGKVRRFGVSNFNAGQIAFLQNALPQKLLFNQLQFGLAHTPLIDSGMCVNMKIEQNVSRTEGTLEYCRLNGITIQAWSPLRQNFANTPFIDDMEHYSELNLVLRELSELYGISPSALAVAWILRHPANMQVILGTTKPERLRDEVRGTEVVLSREQWYRLYKAAGNRIP